MGKTIKPVPRAVHTTVDVTIEGLDDYISNNEKIVEATEERHDELHTIPSHPDTPPDFSGAELNELTDGSLTELHIHEIDDDIDGGIF